MRFLRQLISMAIAVGSVIAGATSLGIDVDIFNKDYWVVALVMVGGGVSARVFIHK